MKNQKGSKSINWPKIILSWGTLILITLFLTSIIPGSSRPDPEAFCPFGGLQALGAFLVNDTLACSMSMDQIVLGIILAVGVVLVGKLFCGYICPMGLITEYLSKARRFLKIKSITITQGSAIDKSLRGLKYLLLFIVFYFSLSSSELFCKNFDPYYAFATGLSGEITLWMSLLAIYILFLGSFFIDMFWCKYICPLGALSNLFRFAILFIIILAVYFALTVVGLSIGWIYLLGFTAILGYILEITYYESKITPVIKIKRDEENCTNCGACTLKCPYKIDVASVKSVTNIDCTVCGDCVYKCPENALYIVRKSGKTRYLPSILLISLIALGFYFGTVWELPMLRDSWADEATLANLESFEIKGMRSVNCFGSSKTFAGQLKEIHGVYGVETYVEHQRVKIFYNPNETTPVDIEASIYTPARFKIANPPKSSSILKVITIRTENMYDKLDPNYLGLQFRLLERGYYGLETEFAHPLIIKLFMDMDEPIDDTFLKSVIEMKFLSMPAHGGIIKKIPVNYKFISREDRVDTVSRREFLERQFKSYESTYKINGEKYGSSPRAFYEIEYPSLEKPAVSRNVSYLSSFLSLQDGFLGIRTYLNDADVPTIRLEFATDILDQEKIWQTLQMAEWRIKLKDGSFKTVAAKMQFSSRGTITDR